MASTVWTCSALDEDCLPLFSQQASAPGIAPISTPTLLRRPQTELRILSRVIDLGRGRAKTWAQIWLFPVPRSLTTMPYSYPGPEGRSKTCDTWKVSILDRPAMSIKARWYIAKVIKGASLKEGRLHQPLSHVEDGKWWKGEKGSLWDWGGREKAWLSTAAS